MSFRAISQKLWNIVAEFGTHDDLKAPSSGINFESKMSEVKITRLESVRVLVYFYSVTTVYCHSPDGETIFC